MELKCKTIREWPSGQENVYQNSYSSSQHILLGNKILSDNLCSFLSKTVFFFVFLGVNSLV